MLSGTSTVTPRHLNKHIDYARASGAGSGTKEASLAIPTAMAVQDRGASHAPLVYVAAFGSSKVGVFDATAARERHVHAERQQPHLRERRRPERPRASTPRATASTC